MTSAKTVVLFFAIQVILSMVIKNPILRLGFSAGILYLKTKDIKTAIMVPIIYWGLAYILKKMGVYETFEPPKLLDDPLLQHEAKLQAGGQREADAELTEPDEETRPIIVPAETRQTVLFSEPDDPDKPDNIVEHPAIPRISLPAKHEEAQLGITSSAGNR